MGTSVARERTAQLRTERMLEAAIGLFCEKGIEETSIEDVAKRAQVGPATVYRYFDTKAELAVRSAREYWKKVPGGGWIRAACTDHRGVSDDF